MDLAMNGYPLEITRTGVYRTMAKTAVEIETGDDALISQTIKGRIKSFRELVLRYQKRAFLYARAMVGNPEDAYDLSQEAFIRVYKHLGRFDPAYPFKVWFFHILSNLCKNHLRQRENRKTSTMSAEITATIAAPISQRPDIIFEKSELQLQLWEAVAELPEKFREIITLCHFQDMSYEQISKILEIPRGSVMSRLYYARQQLRRILEARGITL